MPQAVIALPLPKPKATQHQTSCYVDRPHYQYLLIEIFPERQCIGISISSSGCDCRFVVTDNNYDLVIGLSPLLIRGFVHDRVAAVFLIPWLGVCVLGINGFWAIDAHYVIATISPFDINRIRWLTATDFYRHHNFLVHEVAAVQQLAV